MNGTRIGGLLGVALCGPLTVAAGWVVAVRPAWWNWPAVVVFAGLTLFFAALAARSA